MKEVFDPSVFEWLCDNCGANLDEQEGFNPHCGIWFCRKCAYANEIDEDEAIWKEKNPTTLIN